jgi:hypothetical protein
MTPTDDPIETVAMQAEEEGFNDGETDGYAGNEYDAYKDSIPSEVDENYRAGYRQGFNEGQSAYRRTVE